MNSVGEGGGGRGREVEPDAVVDEGSRGGERGTRTRTRRPIAVERSERVGLGGRER